MPFCRVANEDGLNSHETVPEIGTADEQWLSVNENRRNRICQVHAGELTIPITFDVVYDPQDLFLIGRRDGNDVSDLERQVVSSY